MVPASCDTAETVRDSWWRRRSVGAPTAEADEQVLDQMIRGSDSRVGAQARNSVASRVRQRDEPTSGIRCQIAISICEPRLSGEAGVPSITAGTAADTTAGTVSTFGATTSGAGSRW